MPYDPKPVGIHNGDECCQNMLNQARGARHCAGVWGCKIRLMRKGIIGSTDCAPQRCPIPSEPKVEHIGH